jgi:monovalent cation/proton antiporter MnhG/PhaG subunit
LIEAIVSLMVIVGSLFVLAGSVGLLRLPDFYSRIHAAGLVSTAGIGLLFLAEVLYFTATEGIPSVKGIVVLIGVLVTIPVSTHMLGRAAYRMGVPFSKETVIDDYAQRPPAKDQSSVTMVAANSRDELAP